MKLTIIGFASLALAVLLWNGIALALPSKMPDDTPMVDGRVRTIAQVGTNVWVGGNFAHVEQHDGSVMANVSNVAVFDSATGQYKNIAPMLGDENSTVWDMEAYGDKLVIAGDFSGPGVDEKNLIVVDGTTGSVVSWYDSPMLRSTLVIPELGRIYGGGAGLSAFDLESGKKLWTRARVTVDSDIRSYGLGAGYRDLELDTSTLSPDGNATIWAACACDSVESDTAKALVKLDTEGNNDASWVTQAEPEAFGISLVDPGNGTLYLGAGGNDFLAAYPNEGGGRRAWSRDTSGSAQVVEEMQGQLVVGGHFWEVADQADDDCGHRSSDNSLTLDPNDECQTRHGLAAYSFDGTLESNWYPELAGEYSLVWALHPEAAAGKLYVGGAFLTVDGVKQANYAPLS